MFCSISDTTEVSVFPSCSTTSLSPQHVVTEDQTPKSLTSKPRPKKQAILDRFHHQPISKSQQDKITDALVYMIAIDLLPFRTVEKEGFKKFMTEICPLYKIPSRKVISEVKIPKLFLEINLNISRILENINYMALTTDCWTSVANESYLSITAHFVNENWELQSVCLACKYISVNETAQNIANNYNSRYTRRLENRTK